MTREEQIKKQADIYTDDASNYTEWIDAGWSDSNDIELVEKAFIQGAKWADNNQKSPWISVEDDLPCNHKELIKNKFYTKKVLVILAWDDNPTKRHIELCDMCSKVYPCNTNWRWQNPTYYHVTHWMPIPKLLKE